MFNKKFCLTLIIILLLASLTMTSCKNRTEEKPVIKTVRLSEVIHSMFYAPQYVAISQGFFEEEYLNVELQTAWGGDKAMTALLSNSADIGLIGTETSFYLLNQGSQKKVINFAQLTQKDGSFLLARKPIPDFKWDDVSKKIIVGVRRGSTPEMVMEYVLKRHQIIPQKNVDIIQNITVNATTGAFKGGVGDFLQAFEPNVSKLEKQEVGHVVASFGTEVGKIAYTLYMATETYIQENPDIIQRFTNAIYKAQIWCNSHRAEEIAQAIKPFFPDEELGIIIKAVSRYKNQDTWSSNPIIQSAGLNKLQEVLLDSGEIAKKLPYETIVNNSFAEKAVKEIPLPKEKKK